MWKTWWHKPNVLVSLLTSFMSFLTKWVPFAKSGRNRGKCWQPLRLAWRLGRSESSNSRKLRVIRSWRWRFSNCELRMLSWWGKITTLPLLSEEVIFWYKGNANWCMDDFSESVSIPFRFFGETPTNEPWNSWSLHLWSLHKSDRGTRMVILRCYAKKHTHPHRTHTTLGLFGYAMVSLIEVLQLVSVD